MSFKGSAFLAMWHDIAAEGEADYNRWHTGEHMPEPLGIPGFLVGPTVRRLEPRQLPLCDNLRGPDARRELEVIGPRVTARLGPSSGVAAAQCAVYDLAYVLASDDVVG